MYFYGKIQSWKTLDLSVQIQMASFCEYHLLQMGDWVVCLADSQDKQVPQTK